MDKESTGMLDFSMTIGIFWYVVTELLHATLSHCYEKI